MAINPLALYGDMQLISSDPGWPWGRPQNDAVPGDGSGTPLEQAWVSDLFGWQQALLTEVGATPSGDPDEVGASQYMSALHALFADKSVETRMPDASHGAAVARTGLIIPSAFYPGDVSQWVRRTQYWEATAVDGSVRLYSDRTVPRGFSLSSVSLYFRGPTHTTYPPEAFPTVTVYRSRVTLGSIEMLQQSTMTPASQAIYEADGVWTMTVDPVGVFYEDYDYLILSVAPEYGANALAGTRVYGATIYGTIDRARAL